MLLIFLIHLFYLSFKLEENLIWAPLSNSSFKYS